MKLTHGGDITTYRKRYGTDILDFSANLNPAGMPEAVRKAAQEAMEDADHYPDPLCRDLTAALSHALEVPEGWIVCGNGAADLIFRLMPALKPRRALLIAPGFSAYEDALAAYGCSIEYFRLKKEEGFELSHSILERITPGLDILFLCEPNNPTGTLTPAPRVLEIARACAANRTLLFLDECFGDFAGSSFCSFLPHLGDYPNVLLLKSFTKLYAMAGIRLGYALTSDIRLANSLVQCAQPWSVSSLAEAAGIAALKETSYAKRSVEIIRAERSRLLSAFGRMGVECYGSRANYLFFYTAYPGFYEQMAREGIILRDCSNYEGLGVGYYRAAVRSPGENNALLAAMGNVLGKGEVG